MVSGGPGVGLRKVCRCISIPLYARHENVWVDLTRDKKLASIDDPAPGLGANAGWPTT